MEIRVFLDLEMEHRAKGFEKISRNKPEKDRFNKERFVLRFMMALAFFNAGIFCGRILMTLHTVMLFQNSTFIGMSA